MFCLTEEETLVVATALDDWLEQCQPGDDEVSQARYADIERIRNSMAGMMGLGEGEEAAISGKGSSR
jgi:hypothetical protein